MTERRLAAIFSADVVGYSRLISEDEAGIAQFSGKPMRRSRSWKRGSERSRWYQGARRSTS